MSSAHRNSSITLCMRVKRRSPATTMLVLASLIVSVSTIVDSVAAMAYASALEHQARRHASPSALSVGDRAEVSVATRAGLSKATGEPIDGSAETITAESAHGKLNTANVDVATADPKLFTGVRGSTTSSSAKNLTFDHQSKKRPILASRLTSRFGHRRDPFGHRHVFHQGIDLAAPAGTAVRALAAGTVVKATGDDGAYGNVIVIDHHNGFKTLYAHNSRLMVKAGDKVAAGQPIAKVGSSGHATGPHLHLEIHRNGQRVDPTRYMAGL